MHAYLASFNAQTQTLDPAVDVSGGTAAALVDFPRIAVDGSHALIVTWLNRSNDALMAARSGDHGATFNKSTIASAAGLAQRAGMVHPMHGLALGLELVWIMYILTNL